MTKNICEATLYDLMSQDYSVWITKNKAFGFDLEIEGDKNDTDIEGFGIHPVALESFAALCRKFLYCYEQVN